MYRQSKLLLTLIIMAVCLISAFDFSLSGVPPTEFFRIIVTSNGDVGVLISNYHVGLPEEFPRIPVGTKLSNYVALTYNIGNELTGKVSLDLTGMGEAEADAEFQKIKDFLEGWLGGVLERLKLGYYVESFGERSLVESVRSLFKQRTSAFFNSINSNPLSRSERFRRSMLCWNLFIKLFMPYYNHLKG